MNTPQRTLQFYQQPLDNVLSLIAARWIMGKSPLIPSAGWRMHLEFRTLSGAHPELPGFAL